MSLNPSSSHGGGPAAGSYLPAGALTGVTLDTTTYDNPITGVGKLATIVTTGDDVALAIAVSGDAHPRYIFASSAHDGIYLGNGTIDPYVSGANLGSANDGTAETLSGSQLQTLAARIATEAPTLNQLSPRFTIVSGALPTVALVSGTGAQISTARDAETITPVTFNPGAATTATCTVALSPDNVTYSTLGVETEPAGVAFDGTIHLIKVRVPAGWYLKLTVNAQAVLGTTTYY